MTKRPQRSFWERIATRGPLAPLVRYAMHDVWHVDVSQAGFLHARWTRLVRVVLITGQGFRNDRCLEKAAALTYMTIFSLPALLALAFSLAKGLGAYQRLYKGTVVPFLDRAHDFPHGTAVLARLIGLGDGFPGRGKIFKHGGFR